MEVKEKIIASLKKALSLYGWDNEKPANIHIEIPEREEFGDYGSNVAMTTFENSKLQIPNAKWRNVREYAEEIVTKLKSDTELMEVVDRVEIAGPGFINFFLKNDLLFKNLKEIVNNSENFQKSDILKGKKILVEYAHPNTHKELHIGHMRTLILGESLSRIFSLSSAEVFRANYQGDVGPHVAKAIWGTKKLMEERGLSWEDAEDLDIYQKAHLLGEGYVAGVNEYELRKDEIDELNTKIYEKDAGVMGDYARTRKWSLDYYDVFYKRFGVEFNRLFFESEVGERGKEIVRQNIGRVFEESEGAVVFKGEKYGLHTRVFITKDGNPTYEAKDMALAPLQFSEFPFDENVHVVANEQKGYFEVMIKALELVDPKFKGREYHLPMGMVQLIGQKMGSRTGIVLTVDKLMEEIKEHVRPLVGEDVLDKDDIYEKIALGAVKYSMLKVNPMSDVIFDIKESVSLEGNSGPYLQYTYARTQSVLNRANFPFSNFQFPNTLTTQQFNSEEMAVMKVIFHYPEIVGSAALARSPNLVCGYLYDLSQKFNTFYNAHKIITDNSQESEFRLILTRSTGLVLKSGLNLLGIETPERM